VKIWGRRIINGALFKITQIVQQRRELLLGRFTHIAMRITSIHSRSFRGRLILFLWGIGRCSSVLSTCGLLLRAFTIKMITTTMETGTEGLP
jgi:hypothetical protein